MTRCRPRNAPRPRLPSTRLATWGFVNRATSTWEESGSREDVNALRERTSMTWVRYGEEEEEEEEKEEEGGEDSSRMLEKARESRICSTAVSVKELEEDEDDVDEAEEENMPAGMLANSCPSTVSKGARTREKSSDALAFLPITSASTVSSEGRFTSSSWPPTAALTTVSTSSDQGRGSSTAREVSCEREWKGGSVA